MEVCRFAWGIDFTPFTQSFLGFRTCLLPGFLLGTFPCVAMSNRGQTAPKLAHIFVVVGSTCGSMQRMCTTHVHTMVSTFRYMSALMCVCVRGDAWVQDGATHDTCIMPICSWETHTHTHNMDEAYSRLPNDGRKLLADRGDATG